MFPTFDFPRLLMFWCFEGVNIQSEKVNSSFVTYISFYITQKQPHLTSCTSSPRCVFRPQVSSPFMCKLQHQLTNCLLLDIRLCSAAVTHGSLCSHRIWEVAWWHNSNCSQPIARVRYRWDVVNSDSCSAYWCTFLLSHHTSEKRNQK